MKQCVYCFIPLIFIFFPFHSDPQVTITLEQFKNKTHVYANLLIKKTKDITSYSYNS